MSGRTTKKPNKGNVKKISAGRVAALILFWILIAANIATLVAAVFVNFIKPLYHKNTASEEEMNEYQKVIDQIKEENAAQEPAMQVSPQLVDEYLYKELKNILFCPRCGRIAEYDTYYKKFYCTNNKCNWAAIKAAITETDDKEENKDSSHDEIQKVEPPLKSTENICAEEDQNVVDQPEELSVYKEPEVMVDFDDVKILSQMICKEAHGQPYNGKLAVGQCAMDRLDTNPGRTLNSIIDQPGAFKKASSSCQDCIEAAKDVLMGIKGVPGYRVYHFRRTQRTSDWYAPHICTIGDHSFYGWADGKSDLLDEVELFEDEIVEINVAQEIE